MFRKKNFLSLVAVVMTSFYIFLYLVPLTSFALPAEESFSDTIVSEEPLQESQTTSSETILPHFDDDVSSSSTDISSQEDTTIDNSSSEQDNSSSLDENISSSEDSSSQDESSIDENTSSSESESSIDENISSSESESSIDENISSSEPESSVVSSEPDPWDIVIGNSGEISREIINAITHQGSLSTLVTSAANKQNSFDHLDGYEALAEVDISYSLKAIGENNKPILSEDGKLEPVICNKDTKGSVSQTSLGILIKNINTQIIQWSTDPNIKCYEYKITTVSTFSQRQIKDPADRSSEEDVVIDFFGSEQTSLLLSVEHNDETSKSVEIMAVSSIMFFPYNGFFLSNLSNTIPEFMFAALEGESFLNTTGLLEEQHRLFALDDEFLPAPLSTTNAVVVSDTLGNESRIIAFPTDPSLEMPFIEQYLDRIKLATSASLGRLSLESTSSEEESSDTSSSEDVSSSGGSSSKAVSSTPQSSSPVTSTVIVHDNYPVSSSPESSESSTSSTSSESSASGGSSLNPTLTPKEAISQLVSTAPTVDKVVSGSLQGANANAPAEFDYSQLLISSKGNLLAGLEGTEFKASNSLIFFICGIAIFCGSIPFINKFILSKTNQTFIK